MLRTPSGRIELAPPPIVADVARLRDALARPRDADEIVLVGRRQLRSNNSWMHNLELLVSGPQRCTLHVHPDDAARLGLADGEPAHLHNRAGELEATVEVTDAVMRGVVSLPHGWGHDAPRRAARGRGRARRRELQRARRRGAGRRAVGQRGAERDPGRGRAGARASAGVSAPDFAALGLLDGLEGPARESRAKLLESLHADGCSVEELRSAVVDGRLALLPAELALGGVGQMTPPEVAERAGVDLETLEAMRRAAGLPLPPRDAAALGELDLFGARALAAFLDGGLPAEGLIAASRVFGEAAAHAAAAAGTVANTAIPREGDTEYEYAQRLGAVTRELTPYAAELLGVMYLLHNRENVRQEIVAADEIVAGRRSDVHEVTVGFCDVVGFTRLGEGVPAADLGAIATRLAALAAEVAEPPVRLIKTIGDAVMFVGPEPAPLLDTLLALMEAAEREGEQFPVAARRRGARPGAAPLGRLLRRAGEPRRAARRARPRGRADRRRRRCASAPATRRSPGPTPGRRSSRASRSRCPSSAAAGRPDRRRPGATRSATVDRVSRLEVEYIPPPEPLPGELEGALGCGGACCRWWGCSWSPVSRSGWLPASTRSGIG